MESNISYFAFYKEYIEFNIYFNANYRGIFEMSIKSTFEIGDDKIMEINSYQYHTDFNKYITLLKERAPLLEFWM